jgi:hypothetical protein
MKIQMQLYDLNLIPFDVKVILSNISILNFLFLSQCFDFLYKYKIIKGYKNCYSL